MALRTVMTCPRRNRKNGGLLVGLGVWLGWNNLTTMGEYCTAV